MVIIESDRRQLHKELDDLLSIIICNRGKCEKCRGTNSLTPAHIFSRKNLATRWDKYNVFCLCLRCHSWGHQNPILFKEFVKGKYSNDKYEKLEKKSMEIKKWTIPELERLIKKFKKEIRNANIRRKD